MSLGSLGLGRPGSSPLPPRPTPAPISASISGAGASPGCPKSVGSLRTFPCALESRAPAPREVVDTTKREELDPLVVSSLCVMNVLQPNTPTVRQLVLCPQSSSSAPKTLTGDVLGAFKKAPYLATSTFSDPTPHWLLVTRVRLGATEPAPTSDAWQPVRPPSAPGLSGSRRVGRPAATRTTDLGRRGSHGRGRRDGCGRLRRAGVHVLQ